MVLGHVAITHRRSVELSKCLETVEKLVADQQEEVKLAASDAVDDVLQAMRLNSVS
jgi:hypothetical protein